MNLLNKAQIRQAMIAVARWVDSEASASGLPELPEKRVDVLRIVPLIVLHIGCLGVFLVGWSGFAVGTAAVLYVVRMFAITAFYHRYFSHKTFKADRGWQFVFAVLGNSAGQRGPLWWAGHHRHHHRHVDQPSDPHSPGQHGFWWSHIGWLTSRANFATRYRYVKDWAVFPELRWLNRFDAAVPLVLGALLYIFGSVLERLAPGLGTNGPQMLVWGFFISTTLVLHGTFTVNSVAHLFGSRRYDTPDTSRNNPIVSLLTLGEGWHNNHHFYAVSARQGFFWWQPDPTYYLLRLMARFGIIRDLRPVPDHVRRPAAKKAAMPEGH